MQLTRIIVVYFVLGAVMFGGGAVQFDDSGVTQYFIDNDSEVEASNEATDNLDGLGGAITSLVGQVGGVVVLIWNLVVGIVSFINWPIVVLVENNAPPRVTVLLGGVFVVMFYGGLVRLIRKSA